MKMITMTVEQTEAYDADELSAIHGLLKEAQEMADESGHVVEIYTEDGVLAFVREPQ